MNSSFSREYSYFVRLNHADGHGSEPVVMVTSESLITKKGEGFAGDIDTCLIT